MINPMCIFDTLSIGTSSSVLQKALTESKLGETVIGGGLSDELIQNTFSIGLKGITAGSGCGGTQGDESRNNESSCSDPLNGECKATPSGAGSCLTQDINYKLTMVEDVIYSTLKSAAKHGFDQSAIQASMNIIEFNLREFNTGSYPKGLMMMLGMLPSWIYRDCGAGTNSTTGSPIEAIQFETALQELKDDIAANNSSVFQELIEKYFVENSHRVVVHMAPDVDMEKRLVNQEEKVLADHKNGLKEEDLQLLVLETKKLKEVQLAEDSEEAKATIPKLTLEDIDRQEAVIPICVLPVAEFTSGSNSGGDGIVLKHDLHSNGILYVDVAFDYSSIPQQDLVLLPLFSRMLLECGTFSLSEEELHQLINTETGGIGISYKNDLKYTHNQIVAGNPEDSLLHLVIRGKCTSDKVPQLFDIINEVMSHAKLDNQKRFIEMLRETKAAKESGVINNGHSYAATRLASKMSFLGYLSEHTAGLTYVNNLSELLLAAEADWNSVLVRLENLRSIIYNNKKARDQTDPKYVVNLTGSPSILESNLTYSAVSHFCSNIPTKGEDVVQKAGLPTLRNWSPPATTTAIDNNGGGNMEGYLIPSQVNYVVKGGRLLQPDDKVGTHSELVETDKVRIGAFSVVSKLISNSYLWDHVRVVGGAYGASCSFGTASGRFLFSSYRDPNVLATLDAYDNTVEFLDNSLKLSGAMDQSEVDMVASMEDSSDTGIVIDHDVISQYVIGSIGDLDSPASPDQKGYRSMGEYLRGETNEHKQQYRDEIITTNINDFRTFHNKLKNMLKNADNHAVVLGSENSLIKANEKLKGDNKPKMKLEPAIQSIKP